MSLRWRIALGLEQSFDKIASRGRAAKARQDDVGRFAGQWQQRCRFRDRGGLSALVGERFGVSKHALGVESFDKGAVALVAGVDQIERPSGRACGSWRV